MSKTIPQTRGAVKSREIEIHVPLGLRYQTAKLFEDGGYVEVACDRMLINPAKALSQRLNRTMPSSVDTPLCDGYSLSFSKIVEA